MRAVRIHGYKQVPTIEEVPTPEVGSGEVLICTEAAALNPLDVQLQAGSMERFLPLIFPYTMGIDLAGTVERVGADVTAWQPGDRVIARPKPATGGAFAEFVSVASDSCVALPPTMSVTDGAGIPTAGCTAWKALFVDAGLRAGQTVLIHAGAGGVGSFAVQFAHAIGAYVFATASGDGLELVQNLGADRVIDYKTEAFENLVSNADLVLDTIGGDTLMRSFGVLRPGGHLVSAVRPPDEATAMAKGVTATMVSLSAWLNGHHLKTVVNDVREKSIRVLIDRTLPMAQIADALERQASGRARGKIILTMS